MTIKSLGGSEPHESYGGWERFLAEHTSVRDTFDGVTYYGSSNCNYILFADGTLIESFGYQGVALMATVREKGATATLAELIDGHRQYMAAHTNLCNALDRLSDALERGLQARKVQMAV